MPPTSLVKFMAQQSNGTGGNGHGNGRLHWGRADIDGAPFRGPVPPMLHGDEATERLARVPDAHFEEFDLSDAAQKKAYLDVIERFATGWAQCTFIERRYDEKTRSYKVAVEWMQYYMQDGLPTHAQQAEEGVTPWPTPS